MARLSITLDEDIHETVRELARQRRTSMSALFRYALDKTFEDDVDIISSSRALEEARRDPSSTISWDEYVERRAQGEVPN